MEVLLEEYLGDTTYVYVELETGEHMIIRQDLEVSRQAGDVVFVELA
ncbi:hypothetical protein GCM10007094_36880 [Pseudovibrio japonicus]|uniref:Transport-associated OB type 2 domain-containing protein n=1 Tax=Pseudovibrio japonicus TaxID=366534 RepID=A0ABQ3ETC2_9HYPH|nr:hypothetical protein GCM10007094_36880 [Pseudovibrio japonicus]